MNSPRNSFRLGLVVNPYAGVGGPAARKGSDEQSVQQAAYEGRLALTAPARARTFMQSLVEGRPDGCALTVVTAAGPMGADCCADLPVALELVAAQPAGRTTAEDTRAVVEDIVAAAVDLLVFVGGDGTARDVCAVIGASQVALGVPAGVKMHSGVYAVNPQMAAQVVIHLVSADLVNLVEQEVRDIDEQAFRQGRVASQYYGEMRVPQEGHYVQQVKQGGFEVEELVLLDMADHLQHHAAANTLFIVGPGSTTFHILNNWGIAGTLLGVDLVCDQQLVAADAHEQAIAERVATHSGPVLVVVTAIGGQGHIIGRGNQQISAPLLKKLGRESLRVVATRTKLKSFKQRPMMIDSGDHELDRAWQGYIPVITGFDDIVFYPLGFFGSA